MAATVDNTQIVYQTLYANKWAILQNYPQAFPFIHTLETVGDISGDVMDMPWFTKALTGPSMSFSAANQQADNLMGGIRPTLRTAQYYKNVNISDKDWRLSQGAASYADIFKMNMDAAHLEMFSQLDLIMHQAGNGLLGEVAAAPVGNVVTLTTAQQLMTVFKQGQIVQVSTNAPSTGAVPALTGFQTTVLKVNSGANTITVADASGIAAGNFLIALGDAIGFGPSVSNGAILGVENYNPFLAPVANESFCGVDRTDGVLELNSGFRYTQAINGSRSIEDTIKRLASLMSSGNNGMIAGGGGYMCFLNPQDFDSLDSKLMSSVVRSNVAGAAEYGFPSIVLNTGLGRLDVMSDPHQQKGRARLIQDGALKLRHTAGVLPELAEWGGVSVIPGANSDSRQFRLRAYLQLWCRNPSGLGQAELPSIV